MSSREYKIFGESYILLHEPILTSMSGGAKLLKDSDYSMMFGDDLYQNKGNDETIEIIEQQFGTWFVSVPYLWMRNSVEVHTPEGIYRITNEDMQAFIDSRKGQNLTDEEDALNKIVTNLGECYLIFQRHTTQNISDKTHNVMFHTHMSRVLDLGINENGLISTKTGQANDKHGKSSNRYHIDYKSILIPMNSCGIESDVTFTNNRGSYKKGEYVTSGVTIHDNSYSSPGDFEFKIPSDSESIANKKHIMLMHGYPTGSNIPPASLHNGKTKEVTCLYIFGLESPEILPFFNKTQMIKPEDQHLRVLINKILEYDGPEPEVVSIPEVHHTVEEDRKETALPVGLIRRCSCNK